MTDRHGEKRHDVLASRDPNEANTRHIVLD